MWSSIVFASVFASALIRGAALRRSIARAGWYLVSAALLATLSLLAACASPTGATTSSTPASTAPATATGGGQAHVLVYFSKKPDSLNDPTKVFPVDRYTSATDTATFAIQQLIAGPTSVETNAGYFSEIHGLFSGTSNCGGADFTITFDHRGPAPAAGYTTVQFCRPVNLPGDLAGGYVRAEITATLKQFSNVQNVVILTAQGGCFDDLSGQNLCLGASASSGPYHVLVYFSRQPDSASDPSKVFPVDRYSPTLGVATYAINQLIAGPTSAEAAAGYYSEIHGLLSGSSNCGGADFTITLNHKGSTPATGYATLKFCRTVNLPGDLAGAYVTAEINATLKQFSNIQNVVILNAQGGCFDDLSGQNLCLN